MILLEIEMKDNLINITQDFQDSNEYVLLIAQSRLSNNITIKNK